MSPIQEAAYVKREVALQVLSARLAELAQNTDATPEQEREQKQIIPPRFVVEEVLKEMSEFIAKPPAENILAASFKEHAAKISKLSDQQRATILGRIPMGQMGSGEDIGAACVYLASREAGYVTGQTLHVNGGMAMP